MASLSPLLGLLEQTIADAKQECDAALSQNSTWLQSTVADTKKQLLHRS